MLNKLRKLQNKKGFTLVELIVVIAIIAILTAVIIPLVGRYSAQATYTTLQDAAKSIQTSGTTVIGDITMMGSIYENKIIIGERDGGKLTINVYSTDATPALLAHADTTDPAGKKDGSGSDSDVKMAGKLYESLNDALANTCNFACLVSTNTIKGTIYQTTKIAFTAANINGFSANTSIEADTNFNEAYKVKVAIGSVAVGTQVGVAGSFIPTTT